MNHYEAALARMNRMNWIAEAEVLDGLIAEEADDTAQRAFDTEVERLAAERHGGPVSTHDVALATVTIARRFDRSYDRDAVDEALRRDPETVGYDYLPLRSAGSRSLGAAPLRPSRPPVDDDELEARVAAFAAEGHRILRVARDGYLSLSRGDIRSLRSIRESVAALLPQAADERYLPLRQPAGWS